MSLLSYEDVRPWAQAIRNAVAARRMPPWYADPQYGEFLDDPSLSEAEIKDIVAWVDAGTPRGNPAHEPLTLEFTDEWTIREPDLVLTMPTRAHVKARGRDRFKRIALDPGLSEDKWIQAVEIRPGNHKVVHHAIAYVIQKEHKERQWSRMLRRNGYLLSEYSAGNQGDVYPEDAGRLLKVGSRILLEIHYHPYGVEAYDQTRIALRFHSDPAQVRSRVVSKALTNYKLTIPAGVPNYQHVSATTFDHSFRLLSFQPHMHFRGKSMRLDAIYPDGSTEVLASVPRYNFYWQIAYTYVNPPLIPSGTVLRVTSVLDNSKDNPLNPDPTVDVRWGPNAVDEMAIGWIDILDENLTGVSEAVSTSELATTERRSD